MPPPSPVWAWSRENKGAKVFTDTNLRMTVRIEGAVYETKPVLLKVKQPSK
jgi:hypothetical protein